MTLRRRHRYLGFKILSSTPIGKREVDEGIRRSIAELFGAYGLSRIEPKVIEYDEERSMGILRCNRPHLPMLRASLASITSIGRDPAALFVLRVSGTLKSLRKDLQELGGLDMGP